MNYLIISYTHKNTDIATREKIAFNNDLEKEQSLKNMIDCLYVNEAVVVSTCNRTEIIASVVDISKSKDTIFTELSNKSNISKNELISRADIYENETAVRHLFSVVSSLDSLVVGETQIAGQFKDAYKFSMEKGFCATKLSRIANYSFKCASAVRNATSLGTGSVSVASTAVAQAKEIYKDDAKNIKALVIGAGEMSELTIKHLLKAGFLVTITSRNIKKAELLASTIDPTIEIKPYDMLKELLNSYELMFTATSAPYAIIKKDMIENFDKQRYWFDIALPRDIEEFIAPNIKVYAVDDLKTIVEQNLHLRAEQAKMAYSIVRDMTKEFYHWLNTLGVEPLIKQLFLKSDTIINEKVDSALSKKYISIEDKENITKLCQNVISKILYPATKNLRALSSEENFDEMIEKLREVFDIKEDHKKENDFKNYKCENQ